MLRLLITILLLLSGLPAIAQLKTVTVAENTYAIVGPMSQRGPGNLGNNATFGFVVTPEGVVLIDAGGTLKGAEKIGTAIAAVTDQPVKVVINTGGQDHRWFGNAYWAAKGARIIASNAAIEDQTARGSLQLTAMTQLVGAAGVEGTKPAPASVGFDRTLSLDFAGVVFEIRHIAAAHTPGDAFVWLPETKTVFGGDIVFTQRLLGLTAESNSRGWIDSFLAIEALAPDHVVPGHGQPTDILTASVETLDYLVNLRDRIAEHIKAGGDIISSVDVHQTDFAYLENFDQLAKRNAQRVFEEMEWE